MEPLTTAAISIGSIVATKALEKTGDKVGEALSQKIINFLSLLKIQCPQTVNAIEKASEQPLDFNQAVLEVEAAAEANPQVKQAMEELAATAKDEPNSKLAQILIMPNLQKMAEKIVNFAQGNIEIKEQHITL